MLNPIEFPEFRPDMKLQQQLNELQGKYSKLQSTKNILWTVIIVLGACFIISLSVKRNNMMQRLVVYPPTQDKKQKDKD